MQQNVGFVEFVERCAKGCQQVRREVTNESDGIRDDGLAILRKTKAGAFGSRVANSRFSVKTLPFVRVFRRVDFPALVYPTMDMMGSPAFSRLIRRCPLALAMARISFSRR